MSDKLDKFLEDLQEFDEKYGKYGLSTCYPSRGKAKEETAKRFAKVAWKSVKNPYWDLETNEGNELFEKITNKLKQELPSEFNIKYTTRAWSAKKI